MSDRSAVRAGRGPSAARGARGMAMLLVLIALVVGTVVALSYLSGQTTSVAIAHNATRQIQARALAEDAVALTLAYARAEPTWREGYAHGVWTQEQALHGGSFRLVFEDEADGDLGDDVSEPFLLTVVGRFDGVTHQTQARVSPTGASSPQPRAVLVLVDNATPNAADQAKLDQLTAWGYTVSHLQDSANLAAYDAACAGVDVVYISQECSSNSIGNKLDDQPVGVVSEEHGMSDDLGMSTSAGVYSGDRIDLIDASHPVTAGLSVGEVVVTSGSTDLIRMSGTPASGLRVLAERVSNTDPVLAVVDLGDTLTDGNPSPQRRVFLPVGGNGFRIDELTGAGETLVRQAIDWAGSGAARVVGWHTDFDTDPTAQDENLDGSPDFVVRGGAAFDTASLVGGTWQGGQTLDTNLQSDFVTPTTMKTRMRNTSVGGKGAVVWINFDYAPDDSSFAPVFASLALQGDGSQTLVVSGKDNSGEQALFELTGLAAGYVEVQLDLDPDADTVGVWVDGDYQGAFDYPLKTPDSEVLDRKFATALAWGSDADFDYFTVTPDVTLYSETSGSLNRVVLYEFIEPSPVFPGLVGHWKLDETAARGAFREADGQVVMEAEHYTRIEAGVGGGAGSTWAVGSEADASGGVRMLAEPNVGYNAGLTTEGARLDYDIDFVTPGTYRVWVRYFGSNAQDNSIHVGLNGAAVTNTSGYGMGGPTGSWQWVDSVAGGIVDITVEVPAAGVHTLNVWVREDGTAVDKIVLNLSGDKPSGTGPVESEHAVPAADETGLADGAYLGGVAPGASGFGDGGWAPVLDGSSGYVEVPHQNDYLLDEGAVSLWFRVDDTSGTQVFFAKGGWDDATPGYLGFGLIGSRLVGVLRSSDATHSVQSASGLVTSGRWYHAVMSFGPGGIGLYLDGVEVASEPGYDGGIGPSSGGSGHTGPLVFGAERMANDVTTNFLQGRIDDVRLYDQNLDETQAAALAAGGDPGPQIPAVVEDTANNGTPLDLTIADPGHVNWISGGGLEIHTGTIIASPGPATKLHTAFFGDDALTIEAEFTPANITQEGPARIVSYSEDIFARNVHLAQNQARYTVRLRTEFQTSGKPDTTSSQILAAGRTEHVVFTYDGSEIRLYRNGSLEVTEPWTGDFNNWDATYPLMLGNDADGRREWLGTLHRVAIWDGPMNAVQAENLFNGDPPGEVDGGEAGLDYEVVWLETP
ncbi:MAG: LamG-like jellyroll fold domain-containing protein [Planctomycetota bacterium]